MKKLRVALFGILLAIPFGACNASGNVTEFPIAAQPTETAVILPTSTTIVFPTAEKVMPTFTVMPEVDYTSYEECGSGWASFVRGSWTLCSGFENPITIMNMSGKTWKFSYNSYYGKDVRNMCTRLHHITNDETYLYFSLDPDCELSEPGFIISVSMFRINLVNGEVTEILKTSYDFETYHGDYYSISMSPTGRRMAYIYPQKSPLYLTIFDLQTGDTHSFPLDEKYNSGGMFSWSEDGTKLVFMLESEKDYDHFISMTYLDLLKDNSMVTFIKDNEFNWISSRIEVSKNSIKITRYFDDPLFYDIETGILIPNTQ